jgi:hypothetical protein
MCINWLIKILVKKVKNNNIMDLNVKIVTQLNMGEELDFQFWKKSCLKT